MSDVNPWFFIAAGAGAWFIYESIKGQTTLSKMKKAGEEAKRLPNTSPKFSNMQENPFQQKEKILVEKVEPTQRGQLEHTNMAGRWMLTLPGGTLVPWYGCFEKLKHKVIILIPEGQAKTTPKGYQKISDDRYHMATTDAFAMFEQ
jgi:hypothetical protein